MNLAIETTNLRYRVGKLERAFEVADLGMHVPARSVYGFLGPNGAGKTTTIRLLLGLLKPHSGSITVLGSAMPESYATVLGRVGYVPERPHIYPSLSVSDAMRLHSAFYRTWDQARAEELSKQFGLVGERRISSLSKGETGKLMMLLALAQ